MAKEKVFSVFGLGTFGFQVCSVLADKGAKVIAVDNQARLVEKIKDHVTQAIVMDTTDEELLKTLPLDDIDVAVVAIGDNIEASILTTALLKKLGIPYIIARAVSPIHSQVLKQVGATEVINIEIEEGKRTANKLIAPFVLDTIPLSQNQSLAEVRVSKKFIGKSLAKLDLRKKYNVNVVSIKRFQTSIDEVGNPVKNEIALFPKPTDILKENDILVIIGGEKDIEQLKE
ncbi:MAG: TrkA family potassium uptake protein [Spirochaetes bacterium]|nr:TrkA family potassium uptake protein [Spirochaetota bacterium]